MIRDFKEFLQLREQNEQQQEKKDWKKEYTQLEKGFIPPPKLRPVIDAFLNSGDVSIMKDTAKGDITMDKKPLFLVGGPVRDFLRGKSIKDYDVATPATPEQIAHILHNAGFKMAPDRAGKEGKELHLTFKPKEAQPGDKKVWYVKGRDSSNDQKVFVIGAVVDGEDFDIATFRKDAKVTDGQAAVDFVDNPHSDASRRDLTINSMYIDLTKADGENNKLYDPTGKGLHDIRNGVVRAVGKADERFKEDKLRIMRAIRFHCRFGKGSKMDADIEKAIPRFASMKGVALERIRDEFLKGLEHPDVETKCYLNIYGRTGIIDRIFPGLVINTDIPQQFRDKRDKPLALAWILKDNPIAKVKEVLHPQRGDKNTGWSSQELRQVVFLLSLKDFSPEELQRHISDRSASGLSEDQIRDWVEYFNYKDEAGRNRNRLGGKANQIRAFSEFNPESKDQITWQEKMPHPDIEGEFIKGGVHPEIINSGLHMVHPTQRNDVVKSLNKKRLKDLFDDHMPKNR
jgi:tRNA nucleotidyltransferase/poly(A) polymerase